MQSASRPFCLMTWTLPPSWAASAPPGLQGFTFWTSDHQRGLDWSEYQFLIVLHFKEIRQNSWLPHLDKPMTIRFQSCTCVASDGLNTNHSSLVKIAWPPSWLIFSKTPAGATPAVKVFPVWFIWLQQECQTSRVITKWVKAGIWSWYTSGPGNYQAPSKRFIWG